jgi:CRP-like cAMP-binding protein
MKSQVNPKFLDILRCKVGLVEDELEPFLGHWKTKTLRKKDHLLRAGETSRESAYVNRGCLRRYIINEQEKESVVNFATEDWWIGDLESFFLRKPTRYYVQALEDSELLVLSRDEYDTVLELFPKYKVFHDELIQRSYFATLKTAALAKTGTPDEKYLQLIRDQPGLFQRIPLHYIASYLGIEPESLSRLRKRLAGKA